MLAAKVTNLQIVTVRIYQNAGRNRGCDIGGFLANHFFSHQPLLKSIQRLPQIVCKAFQAQMGKVPFNIFTATVVQPALPLSRNTVALTTFPNSPSPRVLPRTRFFRGNSHFGSSCRREKKPCKMKQGKEWQFLRNRCTAVCSVWLLFLLLSVRSYKSFWISRYFANVFSLT